MRQELGSSLGRRTGAAACGRKQRGDATPTRAPQSATDRGRSSAQAAKMSTAHASACDAVPEERQAAGGVGHVSAACAHPSACARRRHALLFLHSPHFVVPLSSPAPLPSQFIAHEGAYLAVVGSSAQLGEWDAAKALPMAWQLGHRWTASVDIPADWHGTLEYKVSILVVLLDSPLKLITTIGFSLTACDPCCFAAI